MARRVRPAGRPNKLVTGVHSSASDLEWRDKLLTDVVVVVVVARQTCWLTARDESHCWWRSTDSQCDFLAVRFSSSVNFWRRFVFLSKFFDLLWYMWITTTKTISGKLAIGFSATMRLLSNYLTSCYWWISEQVADCAFENDRLNGALQMNLLTSYLLTYSPKCMSPPY